MSRPSRPPEMEFFREPRPAQGERTAGIRLSDLEVVLSGLGDDLQRRMIDRYAPFAVREAVSPRALRVRLGLEDRDYFITPPEKAELNPILVAFGEGKVRYLGYRVAGWFDPEACTGQLLLSRGDYEPPERAIENYFRAAVAWTAAYRGGALVHGAGAALGDHGFLFFGPSGAGKSTLSECNRRARILSDDLTLVLPDREGRPELVGSPFRGTYTGGEPVQGRFPLVAGFRLVQDDRASVREVPRARSFAELVGNLPFVAERFREAPDLFAAVERLFAGVPLRHLHFTRDDSYWDAILDSGLIPGPQEGDR